LFAIEPLIFLYQDYRLNSVCPHLKQPILAKHKTEKVEVFNILVSSTHVMFDMINSKWDIPTSMSELESLGLETPILNELNDSYEVENLVDNLKQMLYQDYKSTHVFTD
jgi:hypothetical protein